MRDIHTGKQVCYYLNREGTLSTLARPDGLLVQGEVTLGKGVTGEIEDFLVDENQTITYLTSQGELRQENPDNSSIPKTCVNLLSQCTSDYWTCLAGAGRDVFVAFGLSPHLLPNIKIVLIQTTPQKVDPSMLTEKGRILCCLALRNSEFASKY